MEYRNANRNGCTVLVAERVESRRHSVRRSLERAGFRILATGSGRDLLELIRNRVGHSPDLLLVDVQLPDISGLEVCRRLRSCPETESIPIIETSERALNSAEIIECFESDPDDYLVYPVPEEELIALVKARIRLRHAQTRRVARVLQMQSEDLRTKLTRLKAAVGVAQLGIWDLSVQLQVRENVPVSTAVRLDRTCRELLGLAKDRPITMEELFALLQADDRVRVTHQILAYINMHGSGAFDTECRIMHPDGSERWVAMRAHAIRPSVSLSRFLRILGTMIDITDRKQAQAVLIHSEKIAALGRMAATLAHDINNPLAAVMDTLFLARSSPECPEALRGYLDVAQEQVQQIGHITRQALGFYRDSATPTDISIRETVDEVFQLFKGKLKAKHITVHADGCDHDIKVVARRGELRQVFANLIANSIDAVEEGGAIKVKVSRLITSHNRAGRYVRITLADNGKGIERSAISHIFEPLFTTKGAAGTGLGLWISKQLIEESGGRIHVRSSTDPRHKGTVVSMILPATRIEPDADLHETAA